VLKGVLWDAKAQMLFGPALIGFEVGEVKVMMV
jgi:hypothetical protein